jgi:serine protease Do
MNHRMLLGTAITIVLLAAAHGVSKGQVTPEPTYPPDLPQIYMLNNSNAHLGVILDEVTPEKAQELKLPAVAGAIITSVEGNSPAAKAGLEKGDVIIEFDGVRIRSAAELRRLVRETPPGRTVAIKVIRGRQARTLRAKLEVPPNPYSHLNVRVIPTPPMNLPDFNFGPPHVRLGISGDDLTSQLAQYFGVKQGKGVLVREVMVGSAAEKAGLKAGDVIVEVDGKAVSDVDELRAALNRNFTDDARKAILTFVRDHHEQTVSVQLTRSGPQGLGDPQALVGLDPGDIAQLKEQAEQARLSAAELWQKVQKQRELMQGEWQRQLRQQLRDLKEQLKSQHNRLTLQLTRREI